MSALEEYLRSRRTRRFPLDETLPDGTPAAQVLLPSVLRMPTEGVEIPEAAPTLQPPPALRARRVFTPPEFGPVEESAAVSPIVAPEGVDYQPGTLAARRRWSSPFNQETERNTAMREVLTDPSQLPKAGRLQRWVVTPLLRAAQGLSATGNAAGGGGGLVAGLVEAAVDPQAATRLQYQRRLGESDANLGRMSAQRQAQLKQAGELADLDYTRARTRDLLNPKPAKPNFQLRDTAEGVVAIDMNDPTRPSVKVAGVKGTADAYDIYDDGTKVWAVNKRNPRDRYSLDDVATKPRPQLVTRTLADGTVVQVPASAALSAETQTEAANIAAGNQFGNQTYEDTVRQQERGHAQTLSQWEAAGREQSRLVKAVEELNEATSLRDLAARQAADPNLSEEERGKAEASRRQWDATGKAREQTVKKIASTLSTAYRDYVEDDDQGWPTRLRPRPSAPAPPRRPAPQRRGAAAAPRPRTPPVAEEDFVNAARQRLGAGFDEGKAREAYRRRYGR